MTDERRWLVVFDTDRIKNYILSTPDLGRMRGASVLLEHLNRATSEDIHELPADLDFAASARTLLSRYASPGYGVVAAGGMAAAVVNSEAEAHRLIGEMRRLYLTATRIASVSGSAVETTLSKLDGRPPAEFPGLMARAAMRLREAKDQGTLAAEIDTTSFLRPCAVCRRYPAAEISTDGENGLVCKACQIKERWGRRARNIFWEEFRKGRPRWSGVSLAKDFGELGETSSPAGYLGLIYADGDGIGSLIEELSHFSAFAGFSRDLDALVRDVTHESIDELIDGPRLRRAPFEILLIGGDDVLLVVAADAALEIARQLTADFAERSGERLGRIATLSAGVVIAHSSFPLKSFHDLGSELLRNAKRNRRPGDPGRIDFLVVTEAASQDVSAVRERVLTRSSKRETVALTRRPYTAEGLNTLLEAARAVKIRIPRHQLHALYDNLFESRYQAQLAGLRARRQDRYREAWDQLASALEVQPDLFPWRRAVLDGVVTFDTPLLDLVEILDFV